MKREKKTKVVQGLQKKQIKIKYFKVLKPHLFKLVKRKGKHYSKNSLAFLRLGKKKL